MSKHFPLGIKVQIERVKILFTTCLFKSPTVVGMSMWAFLCVVLKWTGEVFID